jgi:tRNA nucleotidyltransferase/poly(A) polymerase
MWSTIPESIKILHTLFKEHNKSLFVVGGSVRDFLNKETPKDFDLATDATPEEVLTITKGYKTKLQGEAFGVVVVYTKDGEFEIATFREDIYGDKLGETRNPEVKFTTIDKDVLRRDLTFNALFYDLDKQEIIDLVGGVEDIKNKITRFVGEPTLRIKEDPLRILRLFRFAKRYDFSIDEKSFSAIKELSASLSIITKERIWDETKKAYKQAKNLARKGKNHSYWV